MRRHRDGRVIGNLRSACTSPDLRLADSCTWQGYASETGRADFKRGGSRELKANDAWIAACAKDADATLLTTDRDFSHLKAPDWPVQFCDPAPFMKPGRAGPDG